MAVARLTLTVRLADMDRTRLLLWELMQLRDELRILGVAQGAQLDRVIDRYIDSFDDRPEEADPS